MTGVGRGRAAAAAALALALAGGCSGLATLPPGPPAPVRDAWPGCVAVGAFVGDNFTGPPRSEVGAVPATFVAQRAVLCDTDVRPDEQGGSVSTDRERTSTQIGPLLTYLARPSEKPTDGPCLTIAIGRPWLFLLDGTGRHVAPVIPTDACGLPLDWQHDPSAWEAVPYADRVVGRGR